MSDMSENQNGKGSVYANWFRPVSITLISAAIIAAVTQFPKLFGNESNDEGGSVQQNVTTPVTTSVPPKPPVGTTVPVPQSPPTPVVRISFDHTPGKAAQYYAGVLNGLEQRPLGLTMQDGLEVKGYVYEAAYGAKNHVDFRLTIMRNGERAYCDQYSVQFVTDEKLLDVAGHAVQAAVANSAGKRGVSC